MISWKMGAGIGVAIGLASLLAAPPVAAVTMQECSAQYKAAKSSGTLGNTPWQEFRKARCGPGAPSTWRRGSSCGPSHDASRSLSPPSSTQSMPTAAQRCSTTARLGLPTSLTSH
jgi:hypothetical protein